MPETRFIVEHSIPSQSQLGRFPSLRGFASRNQEIIESLYEEASASPEWDTNKTLAKANAETAREALKFYNTVVKDGRYVTILATEPETAADLLKVKVSDKAIDLIKEAQTIVLPGDMRASMAVAVTVTTVGVAVTVAVVTKGKNPIDEIILDHSGMIKI